MAKCKARVETFSRVCGFFRPVQSWNPGKQAEYREHVPFKMDGGYMVDQAKSLTHTREGPRGERPSPRQQRVGVQQFHNYAFSPQCPMCQLAAHVAHDDYADALKTRLYYEDERIIIVDDLNAREFDIRILGVIKNHAACDSLSNGNRQYLIKKMQGVIDIYHNRDSIVLTWDFTHHAINDHKHFQVGITRMKCQTENENIKTD